MVVNKTTILHKRDGNTAGQAIIWMAIVMINLLLISLPSLALPDREQPNIVLVLVDNMGWGELGVYGGGIIRGAATPRIDTLATQGLRLANFNVETICSTSRASLMTGRYAIRTGVMYPSATLGAIAPDAIGLTQWEVTMAEMLAEKGYVSGLFGKWHLGDTKGRYPTDQGFDEWYGIPRTSDESGWQDNPHVDQSEHALSGKSYIMASRKGEAPKNIKHFNRENRRLIDKEITDRAIDFMREQVKQRKPFFSYVALTQIHGPILPHRDFAGKTGSGDWADTLAQIDSYTGRLLDAIDDIGIRENTIFIFTSDNGSMISGPWDSGGYGGFSAKEGALRVPFIIRWPNQIPKGGYSNEIVHQMDLFPTLAAIVGARVPSDRVIDGVNQLDFFQGKTEKSKREGFVIYVQDELRGVKWRNWKMITHKNGNKMFPLPAIYNLMADPRETASGPFWVQYPAGQLIRDHIQSLSDYPRIRPGTPDPYVPDY